MAALTTFGTDGLLASTIDYFLPTLEDQIFTSKPFLWMLQANGRVKNFNGAHINVPLMYAAAPNVGAYADADVFGTAANTGLSAAQYEFRQFYGLVHFTGIELAKNSGRQAMFSLVEARLKQLELSIAESLDAVLVDDGTDNGSSDKTFASLKQSLSTTTGTVGDLAQTSYAWWQPQLDASSAALSLTRMRKLWNKCSEGNDHPSNILMTALGFEAYEDLIDDNARFVDPKMADAGFQTLMFKGAPIAIDSNITANYAYFLNLKYITLAKLDNTWFKASEWLKPTNADVQYKHIRLYGNLVFSNIKRQGCFVNSINDS
jgi:hypothetical protein